MHGSSATLRSSLIGDSRVGDRRLEADLTTPTFRGTLEKHVGVASRCLAPLPQDAGERRDEPRERFNGLRWIGRSVADVPG